MNLISKATAVLAISSTASLLVVWLAASTRASTPALLPPTNLLEQAIFAVAVKVAEQMKKEVGE